MPYEGDDPESPLNRRISIIVMNRAAEDRILNRRKPKALPASRNQTTLTAHKGLKPPCSRPISL